MAGYLQKFTFYVGAGISEISGTCFRGIESKLRINCLQNVVRDTPPSKTYNKPDQVDLQLNNLS